MSKASEWAKRLQAIAGDAPIFRFQDEAPIASVAVLPKSVKLQLHPVDLTPEDALRLADWIHDTFGDEPAP